MVFQQIRNATVKITFEDINILIDPWFAKKSSLRSIESPDLKKNEILNPTVELPFSIEEIIEDVDICIVTHTHIDHFDEDSISYLPKSTKIFTQSIEDLKIIKDLGYDNIDILDEKGTKVNNIMIYKVKGQHGETLETAEGEACGVVLKSENEKTLYVCGDTIWYDGVEKAIEKYQSEIIVLNACDARLKDTGRLIMNLDDIKSVYDKANDAKLVISHLEAVNHAFINRKDIKEFVLNNNMKQVYIPDDGESITFD